MKVGINIETGKVRVEVSSGGGMNTNIELSPNFARVVASQLIASADTLDTASEQGLLDDDVA